MFFDLEEELKSALHGLRGVERVSFREVEACLQGARAVLVRAGASELAVSGLAGRVMDAVFDSGVLGEGGAESGVVAGVVEAALLGDAVVVKALARHAGKGPTCTECGDGDWRAGRARPKSGGYPLVSQPVRERQVKGLLGTQMRRPFQTAQGLYSCDHHHPGLDRAAVRRLVRSLGPDFGPEPPTGGSLARV